MAHIELNGSNVPVRVVTAEVADWLLGIGENPAELNRIVWPQGASQFGAGNFLIGEEDKPDLQAGDSVTLKLVDEQTFGNRTEIEFSGMSVRQIRPIHVRLKSTDNIEDAVYAIEVVDSRFFWQWKNLSKSDSTNVTLPSDRSSEITAVNSGQTWQQLIDTIATALGISVTTSVSSLPSLGPTDFVFNGDNAARMMDRVVASVGGVFIAKPDQTYEIIDPGDSDSPAQTMSKHLLSGGVDRLRVPAPSQIKVYFPRSETSESNEASNADSPIIEAFAEKTSSNGAPSTGTSGTSVVYDNLWAIGSVGSEDNSADLQSRADELASIYYKRFDINPVDSVYRGFHSGVRTPGRITWALFHQGPTTSYLVPDDWFEYGGDRSVVEGLRHHRIVGVGGVRVGKTYDGSVFLSSDFEEPSTWAKLTSNDGSGDYTADELEDDAATSTGTSLTLHEVNNEDKVFAADNPVVRAWWNPSDSRWEFKSPMPHIPGSLYMVVTSSDKGDSANNDERIRWDWVRVHN